MSSFIEYILQEIQRDYSATARQQDMSATVKAFLRKSGSKSGSEDFEEIRRFAVDVNSLTKSFQYLLQKIKTVFPSLTNKTIQLFYRDSDNDLIAFSSDEELSEALLTEADGVFKVYIEVKNDETPKSGERSRCNKTPKCSETPKENAGNSEGVLHPHVTCDGCEGPVRGTRYKCMICPDYDLCSSCKGIGLHPEHQMSAIEQPMSRPFFPQFGMPPAGPPPCFFPNGPSMAPPFFYGGHGNRDEMRMQRRAWRRWMKSMVGADPCKAWKKEKKDEKCEERKARKAEKKARKEKERAEKTEQTGTEKAEAKGSSSSSSSSDEEGSPTGDYLHNVGQSVAAMLDPLGIDVEIDVEHKGRRKHCHRGFHGGPWGMRGGFGGHGWGRGRGGFWRGMGGMPFGAAWGYNPAGHPSTSHGAPPPPPQDPHSQFPQAPPQYSHDMDTNSETGELRSGVQTPGCGIFVDPFPKANQTAQNSKASGSPEPSGWTLVIDGDERDVDDAARGVEQLQMSGQEAGNGSEQPPSMDQKLVEALDKMMTMGYTDSDGWLTTLLVDNNLDIGRTLDAIMATKK